MNRRRRTLLGGLVATTLALAACGDGSDDASSDASDSTEPAGEQVSDESSPNAAVDDAPTEPAPPASEPPDDADADALDEPTDDSGEAQDTGEQNEGAEESESAEPAPTEPPATAPAAPPVGGRLFAPDVQPDAQFDGNPFPDLVVDDVGKDAKVNVRNILPSDRPVLLWAWAPH